MNALVFAAQPTARLELIASGLDAPVSIQNAGDGSGRLFVAELFGRVRVIREGELLAEPFLDLSDRAVQDGEGGLLGLAFHPRFAENRRFFVLYTGQLGTVPLWTVSEFQASLDEPDQALNNEKILLRMGRPSNIHHAGELAFGPDGYLYISSGDGGPVTDPDMRGQDLGSLLGKILRIGVDGPDQPYTVPGDNPFLGQPGARGEIWAYGLRNPFRMAFDKMTGRLFAADVGSTRLEEVNLIVKGGNYGWSTLEGSLCFPRDVQECDRQGKIPAIHEYGRGDGRAVIGGRVYRGAQATPLWGAYIFGDFVSGRIWALQETSQGVWKRRDLVRAGFLVPVFGEDEQGEIYLSDLLGGDLYRLDYFFQEVLAQVADGPSPAGRFQSVIQLANNQDQAANGVLRFFNPDGSPRRIALGGEPSSEFAFSLPPGTTRSWTTPGDSDPLFSGWAEVSSDLPVSGSVLFTFRESESGRVHRAGLAGSPRGRTFTVPVSIDSDLMTNVGLAVANPSSTDSAQLRAVISDLEGRVLVDFEVELAPLWRGAAFIDELGNLPENFEGTLRIISDRDISPTLLLTVGGLPSASLPPGS
ncbi:MAG: PQQ-dependent sugar dehydrogenase [Acidobacteriota bacterium]